MSQPALPSWHFSEEVLAKAKRYLADRRVSLLRPGVYEVRGSARRPYQVRTDADPVKRTARWISCTCAHGANLGAGSASCSHAVAVLIVIKDRIKLTVS